VSRPRRMPRPVFESLAWQYARPLTSPLRLERDAAMHALMTAFDMATGRQPYRPQPVVDCRAEAEAARQYAAVLNGDSRHVTAGRRDGLAAAIARHRARRARPAAGQPPKRAAAFRAGHPDQITEEMTASA